MRRARRPIQSSVTVMNLASGEKKEYPNVRRFAFAGDASSHIALHRAPGGCRRWRGAGGRRQAGRAVPVAAPVARPGAPDNRPKGTDLILRDLATGAELNVGNVSEFAFNKDGKFLATVIDATDKIGNGVQLRNMTAGTVSSLDTDAANYERLAWTQKGDGLTVLKGKEDRAYIDRMFSIVGFTGFGSGEPKKTVFDPSKDKSFPAGFAISGNRAATWNEKMDAFVFGIREPRKRTTPAAARQARRRRLKVRRLRPRPRRPPARPTRTRRSTSSSGTGRTRASSRSRRCRKAPIATTPTCRCTTSVRRSSSASPMTTCAT